MHTTPATFLGWSRREEHGAETRGFNYKDLEDLGYGLPLVESYVKYKAKAEYDSVITVEFGWNLSSGLF